MSTATQNTNTGVATKDATHNSQVCSTEGSGRTCAVSPRVDITETRDRYILKADMPGVEKSGLDIQLENNELTLIGRRTTPVVQGEVLYGETHSLEFRRTFTLDPSIDAAKISARLDQGTLTLDLPKAEAVRPRKIAVTE